MQLNRNELYIGPELSKKILSLIHNGENIDYKKFKRLSVKSKKLERKTILAGCKF